MATDLFEGREGDDGERHRDFLLSFSLALKLATVHNLNNQAMKHPVDELARTVGALWGGAEIVLRLAGNNVFVDDAPVRLDSRTLESAQTLQLMFARLEANELVVRQKVGPEAIMAFLGQFQQAYGHRAGLAAFGTTSPILLRLTIDTAPQQVSLSATEAVLRGYGSLVVCVQEELAALAEGRLPRLGKVRRAVQILTDVSDGRDEMLLAVAHLQKTSGLPVYHLASVAALTLVMARRLGARKAQLAELATAALFHDTGLLDLPPPLDEAEYERAMQDVGPASVRYACSTGPSLATLHRVAIAHEIQGDLSAKPLASTRLISVACAYATMTGTEAPGMGLPPEQAVRFILYSAGERYDETAARLLAHTVGLYPVGTSVLLSDGTQGVVVGVSSSIEGFTKPRVRLVDPATGQPLREVDLNREHGLSIVSTAEPLALSQVMENFLAV